MKFFYTNNKKGFTLIETFVAITILLIAIVGPMTIASRGIQSALFAKDQITAFYLAQEAIEFARWDRDNYILTTGESTGFFSPTESKCTGTEGCSATIRQLTYRDCDLNSCVITFDDGGLGANRGFYAHGAGDDTIFTRNMWITETSNDREAEVIVQVSWESGLFGGEKMVEVKTRIFNYFDSP